MKKLVFSAALALAMMLSALPAVAQEEKKEENVAIPEVVQITDPQGDANYQGNDWQTGNGPVKGADVLQSWFTNDAETISLHIQTNSAPGAAALFFRTYTNPNNSITPTTSASCLVFRTWVEGLGYPSATNSYVTDGCGKESKRTDGETSFSEGPGGTSILTATFPRTASPHFEKDSVLFTPFIQVWQTVLTNAALIDNTKPGADYQVVGELVAPKKEEPKEEEPEEGEEGEEGEEEEPEEEPEAKPAPKKGKKKGACPAFEPGEKGVDKPTVTVTDEATEEKPLEQVVTLGQSTADFAGDPTYDQFNVVVDSKAAEAGLYATLSFPTARDYDLDLLHTDGSYAARSHGFNPIGPLYGFPPFQGSEGHGGKTTASSESLVGIKTNDCGGWTVEAVNWLGEGGELKVKLWLGEAKVDPQAPGEET